MILVRCPYCSEIRTEDELTYGGETTVIRPTQPEQACDTEWTEYLYFRTNSRGTHLERWCCSGGCSRWFKVARDTVSHDVIDVLRYDLSRSESGSGERITVSRVVMNEVSHDREQSGGIS